MMDNLAPVSYTHLGVHRKDRALLPPAEQKQRRIQQQKKQRQGVPLRRDLPEQQDVYKRQLQRRVFGFREGKGL